MSSEKKVLQIVILILSGCGYGNYRKTDDGSVENKSKYDLEVKVSEGCYDGKTHILNVPSGETKPFEFSYTCNGHDDESAHIQVAYLSYEERGYGFYSFDPSLYTTTEISEGSNVHYAEDKTLKEYTIKADDLNVSPSSALRSASNVYFYGQMIGIRPSTDTIGQLFYGIAKSDISPFVPLIAGYFEEQGVVYQPMVKEYYKHKPDYNGQELKLVCDDINCFSK
jgi:hypothetical protein